MGDPRNNDDHVDEIVRRLAAEFGPRHIELQQCIAHLSDRLDRVCDRLDLVERQIASLERKASFDHMVKQAGQDVESLVPAPDTPRPLAIDRACGADPSTPATVLMPEFGMNGLEVEPEPGADPKTIWPTIIETIRAVEGA